MIRQKFEFHFGKLTRERRVFFAPGRVNLIGEHTDFTGGYVLPAALNYGTYAWIQPRQDGKICLASTSYPEIVEISEEARGLENGEGIIYRSADNWGNYPKGVIREFVKRGIHCGGYNILFHGNLPKGAGLSSSASLELVTALALTSLENLNFSLLDLVQISLRAENDFVGVQCGIMDQFAVGMGKSGQALLLKCDTLEYRAVPIHLGEYEFIITNSNKPRNLAESSYNLRRQEVEAGFQGIRRAFPELKCLGDLAVSDWQEVRPLIASLDVKKRIEHIVIENVRTQASAQALAKGELLKFGQLMQESHRSLRDLYEVTGRELDILFEEALKVEGCLGTRMTGAGFGGCTVSLVHHLAIPDFKRKVALEYEQQTGRQSEFYSFEIGAGVCEITQEVAI